MQDTTVTLMTPANGPTRESMASAISWASIIAGALAITASSVILVTLAGSLGLAPSGPPDNDRMGMMMTSMAAIWLIVTQWIASGIGGYLTGRMRTRWVGVHNHEVFFRDTAHGFLAWSLALVIGLGVLTAAGSNLLGHMHKPMMGGMKRDAGPQMSDQGPMGYYLDMLYRTPAGPATTVATAPDSVAVAGTEGTPAANPPASSAAAGRMSGDVRGESARILMRGMGGTTSDEDKNYLKQMVSAQTGLSQAEASTRVDNVLGKAQDDARKMRKGAATLALFTGLAMLIGAFIASAASAFGGSQRDEWEEAHRNGTYIG